MSFAAASADGQPESTGRASRSSCCTAASAPSRWDGSGRPASRLAILPGFTHYTVFSAPALAATVIPFLDEPAPTKQ